MLTPQELDSYYENGFIVVRGLLSADEVATLRRRADDFAAGRIEIPQGEVVDGRSTGVIRRKPSPMMTPNRANPETNPVPEIKLTDGHARRGYQVYPTRKNPVDSATIEAAIQAMRDAGDPWADVAGMEHLCDYDDVFRRFAAHPKLVGVLTQILGPNVKLFFDHLYHKMPYGGPNRYHQDGFFEFSDRSCTVWVALDQVTLENGCLRYIPDGAAYGQFKFDQLGEAITARELAMEVMLPLEPGDAAIHDRWTLHSTGPNETAKGRRGWACHYTSAKSRFVDDPTFTAKTYTQTADGKHIRDDVVDGNRHYFVVAGREFPGCI